MTNRVCLMPLEILPVRPCLQQKSAKVGVWRFHISGEVPLVSSGADTTVLSTLNGISHLCGFFSGICFCSHRTHANKIYSYIIYTDILKMFAVSKRFCKIHVRVLFKYSSHRIIFSHKQVVNLCCKCKQHFLTIFACPR